MITLVCQYFDVSARVNQMYFSPLNVFTSSLSGFQSSYDCNHFCQCEDSSFPKSIELHVSVGFALTGFIKSSKYSLHHEWISFSSLWMFPVESYMEVVVLKVFLRKRRTACRNTLFYDEPLESNRRLNSAQERSSDIFLPELQLFAPRNTAIANQMITCFATTP